MAELKTKPGGADAKAFLAALTDGARREECAALADLMVRLTGAPPVMWGASIVGFGRYRYRYDSGREGEWFQMGFSPRKQALTLYVMSGFDGMEDLMARLGPHKTGKSCLYLKRLRDADPKVLEALLEASLRRLPARVD